MRKLKNLLKLVALNFKVFSTVLQCSISYERTSPWIFKIIQILSLSNHLNKPTPKHESNRSVQHYNEERENIWTIPDICLSCSWRARKQNLIYSLLLSLRLIFHIIVLSFIDICSISYERTSPWIFKIIQILSWITLSSWKPVEPQKQPFHWVTNLCSVCDIVINFFFTHE